MTIAGIHPLRNHAATQIVILNMIHSYIHSCHSFDDPNICPHAFMITGIHPLLNHAVTQIVKFHMIHS